MGFSWMEEGQTGSSGLKFGVTGKTHDSKSFFTHTIVEDNQKSFSEISSLREINNLKKKYTYTLVSTANRLVVY